MKKMKVPGGLGLAVAVAVTVLGARAHAQSCQALVNEMRTRSATEWTIVSVASGQANKLSSSAAAVNQYGRPTGAFLRWNGFEMSSLGFGAPGSGTGSLQYNDRYNPGYLSGASQNFSTHAGGTDGFELWIKADGSLLTMQNLRWGNRIVIANPTCSDGVMYGFGNAVGNTNGGLPALYVFSFAFMPEIT